MIDIMPGKIYSAFAGMGNSFNGLMGSDSVTFLLFYTSPTKDELSKFSNTTSIQLRLFAKGELFFTVKLDNFPWMDSPYTPHIGDECLQSPPADGYKMRVALIDSMNGRVESILTSQLDYWFSQKVYEASEEARQRLWDKSTYHQRCSVIMNQYSSLQLASAAAI